MRNHGYIFVYGSLKIGGYYSDLFDSERISSAPAKVMGLLYNLNSFPGLVLGGNREVHGELHLYKNFSFVVRHMDFIEGYRKRNDERNLYHKCVIEIEMNNGKRARSLIYTLNTDRISPKGCAIVEDGRWLIN